MIRSSHCLTGRTGSWMDATSLFCDFSAASRPLQVPVLVRGPGSRSAIPQLTQPRSTAEPRTPLARCRRHPVRLSATAGNAVLVITATQALHPSHVCLWLSWLWRAPRLPTCKLSAQSPYSYSLLTSSFH